MNKNLDQLQNEVSEITKSLDDLKKSTRSDMEKNAEKEKLKNKAKTTKWEIQKQIDELKDKTDEISKETKEKAETLLKSLDDVLELQSSIWDNKDNKKEFDDKKSSNENNFSESSSENEKNWLKEVGQNSAEEEKWFWWKAWDWIWEQWSDVTSRDKRKEQPWQNALRFIWWLWIWLAWYGIYKWAKKLWNRAFWKKKKDKESEGKSSSESSSKKDNSSEEKSFWDGTVWKTIKTVWSVLAVWTWVYYVTHGLYTKNRWLRDLWDREKGKKLEFDAALEYCKWAIANQDNKEGMSYGMDLKYHEDTWEIEAYWEKIKIDKDNRKIPWVWLGDVEFKKYEHMINTAILIAYLKKNYSWQCQNNSPFHLTGDRQWDINVNTSNGSEEAVDWTGNWGRIVGVTAGWIAGIVTWIFWWLKAWAAVWITWWIVWYMAGGAHDRNNIMNNHMPELDNEFWKKSLWAYLNTLACWEAKNQAVEDITESPIKKEIEEFMKEIQNTSPELDNLWAMRQINAIQDPNNEKKYTIQAYGRDFSAEVTWNEWGRKIKILWISWWNPTIKTNMEISGLSWLELPLKEWLYMSCLTWFLLEKYHNQWNEYPRFEYTWRTNHAFKTWIYFSKDWSDTRVYSKDIFQQKMPTLFQEENRNKYLKFLNDWITWENNISIRKK